jgi:hypothetical protein
MPNSSEFKLPEEQNLLQSGASSNVPKLSPLKYKSGQQETLEKVVEDPSKKSDYRDRDE